MCSPLLFRGRDIRVLLQSNLSQSYLEDHAAAQQEIATTLLPSSAQPQRKQQGFDGS